MSALHPCPSCARHVRASEPTCPFCASALSPAEPRAMPTTRLSRAALFAFGATLAACGGPQHEPQPPETTIMQPYGAPPIDPDPDPQPPPTTTSQNDPPPDPGGTVVAAYGAPAPPSQITPPPRP